MTETTIEHPFDGGAQIEESAQLEERSQPDWGLRATACELLALSFRYPGPQLPQIVASGEWLAAASEIGQLMALDLPEDFGQGLDVRDEVSDQELLHALRKEATRLFVGAPKPAISPYEGVWRAADDGVNALLFVNPHSMDVERFCKACGLGRPEGTNEPLDHVATELELLEYLASIQAGIGLPVASAPAEEKLPGGSIEGAFGQFMIDHVMTWMPRFAQAVAYQATQPFYRAAGQLLKAFLDTFAA